MSTRTTNAKLCGNATGRYPHRLNSLRVGSASGAARRIRLPEPLTSRNWSSLPCKKPVLRQHAPVAAGVSRPPAVRDEELPSLVPPSANLALLLPARLGETNRLGFLPLCRCL